MTESAALEMGPNAYRACMPGSTSFNLFLLASLLWLNLMLLFDIPLQLHHLVGIAAMLGAFAMISVRGRRALPKSAAIILLLAAPLLLTTLVTVDLEGFFFVASYVGAIVGLLIIGRRKKASVLLLTQFFLLGVLPDFVYGKWIRGPVARHDSTISSPIPPTAIPTPANHWRINIGPYGSTFHYTSDLGVVIFTACLVKFSRTRKRRYLALGALGTYFVLFSGARSGYIAVLINLVLFAMNRSRRRPRLSCALIVFIAVFTYGINALIPHLPGQVIASVSRFNETRHGEIDPTTDRSWLWAYHMRLFSAHPFTGAGMSSIRITRQDIIDGQFAPATSESFYTSLLAAFGLSGLAITAIHLYLFKKTLRHPDLLKLLYAATILVLTMLNSMLSTTYVPMSFFVLAYVCSDLDLKPGRRFGRPKQRRIHSSMWANPAVGSIVSIDQPQSTAA